jgi:SAM-dependent methyltransferase
MDEASKAAHRRFATDIRFASKFLVGKGIDIGAGRDSVGKLTDMFPLMTDVKGWDWDDGDAQHLRGVQAESYDFVHSSHCLEHMVDPYVAIANWFRILKPGGHLVVTVPDEDLYEQGVWPSTFNTDHKWTFTIHKHQSWSPKSVNVLGMLSNLSPEARVIKVELIDTFYQYDSPRVDQTGDALTECAIEFVVRKER